MTKNYDKKVGHFVSKEKRTFSTREEAEPFRLAHERWAHQPVEIYRCEECGGLHIGRTPKRLPGRLGSGDWERLCGQLVGALKKVLDRQPMT